MVVTEYCLIIELWHSSILEIHRRVEIITDIDCGVHLIYVTKSLAEIIESFV